MAASVREQMIRRTLWREGQTQEGFIVEGWSQGFLAGSLLIMGAITIASMRKGVLLHKLILTEQILAFPHATFCFMSFKGYGWYVSSTATLLYISYVLHNVVAWMKVKPFFVGKQPTFFDYRIGKIVQRAYYISLGMTVPVWIFNTYNNFEFNNNLTKQWLWRNTRPFEFLERDPWWVFTNAILFRVIAKSYGIRVIQLVRLSPRLAILFLAIFLSISFTLVDLTSSIIKGNFGGVEGFNPYWKLSLTFKCLTDAIMLDDFATELKRISGDRRVPGSNLAQTNFDGRESKANDDEAVVGSNNNDLPSNEEKSPISTAPRYPERVQQKASNAYTDSLLEIEDVGGLAS